LRIFLAASASSAVASAAAQGLDAPRGSFVVANLEQPLLLRVVVAVDVAVWDRRVAFGIRYPTLVDQVADIHILVARDNDVVTARA
jgi:hypothetical protein